MPVESIQITSYIDTHKGMEIFLISIEGQALNFCSSSVRVCVCVCAFSGNHFIHVAVSSVI